MRAATVVAAASAAVGAAATGAAASPRALSFAADPIAYLFAHGVRLIAGRPQSVGEVRRKLTTLCLRRRRAPTAAAGAQPCDEVVAAALARLADAALLDDIAYAEYHVDNRARFRPRSRAHLLAELSGKGVERGIATAAVAADHHDDVTACLATMRRRGKHVQWTASGRLDDRTMAYLMRRGYGYATVHAAATLLRADATTSEPLR